MAGAGRLLTSSRKAYSTAGKTYTLSLGSPRLREATAPSGGEMSDDEVIKKQLQGDLDIQEGSQQASLHNKARKRKARDLYDATVNGVERRVKKKQDKRDRAEKGTKYASEGVRGISEGFMGEYPSKPEQQSRAVGSSSVHMGNAPTSMAKPIGQPLAQLESTTVKGSEKMERTDKNGKVSELTVAAPLQSLGSHSKALLESILKDCSPGNVKDLEVMRYQAGSVSDAKSSCAIPKASSNNVQGSPKGKPRKRVSMVPILPEGYMPLLVDSKMMYHCPVDVCDRLYTRRATLGEHMNTVHAGQILNDNHDGTMSVITPQDFQIATATNNGYSQQKDGDPSILHRGGQLVTQKGKHTAVQTTISTSEEDESASADAFPKKPRGRPNGSKTIDKSFTAGNSAAAPQKIPSRPIIPESDSSEDENMRTQQQRHVPTASPVETTTTKEPKRRKSGRSHSNISSGVHHVDSEAAMEEWEVAPRKIRGTVLNSKTLKAEGEEDIAFSCTYFNLGGFAKFPGVHFHVQHLAGGESRTSNVPWLRICSVASGKVHVNLAGNKEFRIGAHGMWRIQAHEWCIVTNRNYDEAVIHVSTIRED